jgi:hypothetical protein
MYSITETPYGTSLLILNSQRATENVRIDGGTKMAERGLLKRILRHINPLKDKINLNCIYRPRSHRAVNTPHLGYKNQSVDVMYGKISPFVPCSEKKLIMHCVGKK